MASPHRNRPWNASQRGLAPAMPLFLQRVKMALSRLVRDVDTTPARFAVPRRPWRVFTPRDFATTGRSITASVLRSPRLSADKPTRAAANPAQP